MRIKHKRNIIVNLTGLLFSLGIALGGILLVQNRLLREKTELLHGTGSVKLQQDTEVIASEAFPEAETVQIYLAEEELTQTVQNLENGKEIYPHEPRQNQLTMARAMEYGSTWLKTFVMPHLGLSCDTADDFRTSCYLWTPREEIYYNTDQNRLFSYWTINLTNRELDATLILNAVSGQILDASIICSSPVEYQSQENLMLFLWDYADSFGLNENYTIVSSKNESSTDGTDLYQTVGSDGIFAVLQTGDIVFTRSDADTDSPEYEELFSIRLYLTYGLPISSPSP